MNQPLTKDQMKEKIRLWFDKCDTRNLSTRQALYRAVCFLWSRQTPRERKQWSTGEINGVGLNKFDAPYIGMVCREFSGQDLPNKVALSLKFRLQKYAGQLADLALTKTEEPVTLR